MLKKISKYFTKKDETQDKPAYLVSEEKPAETIIHENKPILEKCKEQGLDYILVRGVLRELLDRGIVNEFAYESSDENMGSYCLYFISENFTELCKRAKFETPYKKAVVDKDLKNDIFVLKASI